MTQADFTFYTSGDPVGGPDGGAQLHSGLASPLVGAGSYCRRFSKTSGTGYLYAKRAGTVPATSAVSLRGWFRASPSAGARNAIGMGQVIDAASPFQQGHVLSFGTYNGAVELTGYDCRAIYGRGLATASSPTYGQQQFSLAALAATNTWHAARLDIIPIAGNAQVMRVYSGAGTPGSETWTLLDERTVSAAGMDGFHAFGGGSMVGFFAWYEAGGPDPIGYIDHLRILVKAGGPF
jgi:hypothetical protein